MDRIEKVIQEERDRGFSLARKALHGHVRREYRGEFLLQGYAHAAELAEYRRHLMGKELNKLQQRIGRQRKANRKLQQHIQWLEKENSELRRELASYIGTGRFTAGGNQEGSTSAGFDSTTEHGTGEAPSNRP